MTSNWKNRWVAVALATTMTATTIASPVAMASQTPISDTITAESSSAESSSAESSSAESSSAESSSAESSSAESSSVESSSVESSSAESSSAESSSAESSSAESSSAESSSAESSSAESSSAESSSAESSSAESSSADNTTQPLPSAQWSENSIFTDGFEEIIISQKADVKKYWKNGVVPKNWDNIWVAMPPSSADKMYFEVVKDQKTEGSQAVHIHSEDSTGRLDIMTTVSGLDYSKNYILRMKLKTENVSGFYPRVQIGAKGNKALPLGDAIKGTNDWFTYEMPLKDLASAAGDNSGVMKIELFADKMTGDVWIDQLEVAEDYTLAMEQEQISLKVGETAQLKVVSSNSEIDLSKLEWSSSDPSVVSVDSNGNVQALKLGVVEITAKLDDTHFAQCTVKVSDPDVEEPYYTEMRERWTERLTGNSYWQGENTSPEYKQIIEGYDKTADEILAQFVENSEEKLFNDLDLNPANRNHNSTSSDESAAFATAMERINHLAKAWASKGSKYYQDETLKNKILYAMQWSYDHFYSDKLNNREMFGNWWHWWIGMPQNLAGTVILMHDVMSEDLLEKEAATLANFNEDPIYVYKVKGVGGGKMNMTAANLADTSLVALLRGVACGDAQAVAMGTKYFDRIAQVVTSGEGIYPDGSFIQHTNLAYTGGYGSTLLNGVEKLVYLTNSTLWQIQEQQLNGVYNWIWDGIRPLYANGAMFDMVSGRGIARPSRTDYTTGLGILSATVLLAQSAPQEIQQKFDSFAKAQMMAAIEYMGAEDYYSRMNSAAMMRAKSIIENPAVVPVSNNDYAKAFGAMDKAVAHSERFSLGISMASSRTGRTEFGNEENKKGWHQSDGATYIYNGDPSQYADNYWNTVDPHRLAGITTDHSEWKLGAWGNYPGNANYVGGAALGQYGAFAMNFKNYSASSNPNLTAKKTWFVFDDEVVALGAGIQGIDPNRTTETIVENKKVKDDASNKLVIDGKEYTDKNNTESVEENVSWAWLEGNNGKDAMGYYFPSTSDVTVKREARSGSWKDINGSAGVSEEKITKNYVSLAVEHGDLVQASNSFKYENYEYVLLPGKNESEVKAYAENPDIEVLANGAFVQAARDNRTNVSSYVFWEQSQKKSVRVGNVESDYGTVVVKDNKDSHTLEVSVASPLQNKDEVKVRIYGNNLKPVNAGEGITVETDKYGAVITVNTKNDLGVSHTLTLSYEEPSEQLMAAYQKVRDDYRNNLTGNTMPDKNDPQYRSMMEGYDKAAKEAWETMVKDENRITLWEDLNLTLDYINKGGNNNDSADFRTATERLRAMALAYASEGSKYYQNQELLADLQEAVEYVLKTYPRNLQDKVYGNWWTWAIGVPKDLAEIAILLYNDLQQETINNLYTYVDTVLPAAKYCWMRSKRPYLYTSTAANTMDMGVITALNGAVGNDSKGLYMASDALPLMMKYVTEGDGFYSDGSFKQHGTLAYTGGYGADALRGVAKIASITTGTPWECTEVNPNMAYEWIMEGFRPLFAQGAVMEMVSGRQISRYNRNDITTARYIMDAVLMLIPNAPEQYKEELLSFAKTQAKLGIQYDPNIYYGGKLSFGSLITLKQLLADDSIPEYSKEYVKIFAQMDKATVQNKDFGLGISMYSSRSGNAECGNSENYKGWYMSDGATFLYNGDQAQFAHEFWPTMDMTRLAGITTNHVTGDLGNFSAHTSSKDWVGGSSVGEKYASIGMDFEAQFSDLTAKKSWFAFGDQIIALGAGITGTEGDYTETVVENRKIKEDASNRLVVNGEETVKNLGDKQTVTADWAWLEQNETGASIGYYFPESANVTLRREANSGKWQDINKSSNMINEETAKELTHNYASIAIEHGEKPQGETYSYVLLPNRTEQEMQQYAQNNGIQILSNTEALQAVADSVSGAIGLNFWQAGEMTMPQTKEIVGTGISKISTDAPASVTVWNNEGMLEIGVSDPTQKAESITVRIEGQNLNVGSLGEGVNAVADQNGVTLTVNVKGALGATFAAQVADEAAMAKALLNQVALFMDSGLTTENYEQAQEFMARMRSVNQDFYTQEELALFAQLSTKLETTVANMEKADETANKIQQVEEVNAENIDQVKQMLAEYEALTPEQKALLSAAQKEMIANAQKMVEEYENQKPVPTPVPTATPAPTAMPTPAPTAPPTQSPVQDEQEQYWLGVLAALQNAKKGETVRSDASKASYIPGYIITTVKDKGVTLILTYQGNTLKLTAASLTKANGSFNYTMQDLVALLVKTGGEGSVVKETNGGTLPENNTTKQPQNPSVGTDGNKQQAPTEPSVTLPETTQTQQTTQNNGFIAGILAVGATVLAAAGLGVRELLRRRKNEDE